MKRHTQVHVGTELAELEMTERKSLLQSPCWVPLFQEREADTQEFALPLSPISWLLKWELSLPTVFDGQ